MSLSPHCWIHSLPNELISHILVMVIETDSQGESEQPTRQLKVEFPRQAQLVCRRWNGIACDTPALWTFLDIETKRSGHSQLFLKRSGVLPLEVHLEPPASSPKVFKLSESAYKARVKRAKRMIQEHAHRIWKLEIDGGETWDIYTCVESLPSLFANLRELSVFGRSFKSEPYRFSLDLTAPLLRSLTVHTYFLHWAHLPTAPHLEELWVIEDVPTPVLLDELANVFKSYSNLRELQLCNQGLVEPETGQWVAPTERVHLGKLEVLSLRQMYAEDLTWILGLLDAPRLEDLELVERGPDLGDTGMVLELDFPVLETLTLEVGIETAVAVVQQVPSIKELSLARARSIGSYHDIDSAFKSMALHWRARGNPLPLETLVTKGVRLSSLPSLIESGRANVVPSLHRVSVHVSDTLSENEEQFVEYAGEMGRLSALVDFEIHGLSDKASRARRMVDSLEKEQNWVSRFKIKRYDV